MADAPETSEDAGRHGVGNADDGHADAEELLGALRDLSARVGSIQTELHTLSAQTRALPRAESDTPGWEDGRARGRDTLAWVRSVDHPAARRPAIPMMLLELAFLAAVAVGLALADIDAATIVGVMAGAWILVALAEWIGAQAARRRAQAAYAPLPFPGSPASADPSWFAPPLERTTFGDTGELTDTGGLEDAEPVHETPPKLPPSSVVD